MVTNIAPGARILCRDAEWLVKSVSLSSDGDSVIEAVGVSEFLRGRRVQFLKEIEEQGGDLQVLKSEETELVADSSSGYTQSLLFIEANLKQIVPEDGRIYLGQYAAMDALDYQLYPAALALQMPRQRLLIADAVGLGKTLECGILVAELIRRGKGRRILVVTTKSMMGQFQKEFWLRFTIPLVRLDSVEIQRVRSRLPGNHNPFHYYDRAIISIDTLKQDREYRSYLEQAYWDIIIIDEAHNVAKRGKGESASQRSKLAERLATRSDTLILLSATPHDGRPESFASLMNMLDPTAIANECNYTKDDIRDLYVRRFKKDVLQDLKQNIPERHVEAVEATASVAEERVFQRINDLHLATIDKQRKAGQLFKTTLLKAMLSSPQACLETVHNRLQRLQQKESIDPSDDRADIVELQALAAALAQVELADFSKYQQLLQLIQKDFQWTGKNTTDRLVIFTGRLATLRFLQTQLAADLQLKPQAIAILDGGMADVDQVKIVEEFGQEKSPVRILIATEVASEGLNLHYLSHKLIHFDIPWSLMTLQQRNGRIDRYGQTRQPEIRYLLTRSTLERMDEVKRIIQVLLVKDEQAIKNIGDPSVFMGVFAPEAEEAVTAEAIETGISAEEFSQKLDGNAASGGETDIFSWFENEDSFTPEATTAPQPIAETGKLLTLFNSTFDFAVAALRSSTVKIPNLTINQGDGFIELQLPEELKSRYDRLPPEICPDSKSLLHLTDRPQVIMAAMVEARRQDADWSQKQYLWDLHPLVEWLSDRCLFYFGRHQAPVIQLSQGISPQEAIFICFGSFPNRRGSSILNRWVSVIFQQGQFQRVEPFADTVQRTQLGKHPIPNSGGIELKDLLPLRSVTIQQARTYLQKEREIFQTQLNPKLQEQQERLERLQGYHVEQLELSFEQDKRPQTIKEQQQQKRRTDIDKIFQDYRDWVNLSMTTETEPYIKLIAVLRG
ncbi:DEAD/DEAH box helicase [Nodularia spumigena]|jgi:ERCC4-related helicase|uniref:DEAD/DEAH box helicase n=1 Tax=Nodularia spumigena TaxID=70799 RepID=UPI002B1F7562|nr:DEAD/DEAH box helicase [Nodularia spumigena]MEA5555598.1 DEAD/DEAH box helicase [Nodularia spumigena CH309]